MPFEIKPMKWYEKENVGHGLGTYRVLDDPATGQWRWERRHHGLFEETLGFPSRDAAKASAEEWDRQLVREFLTPLTVRPLEWRTSEVVFAYAVVGYEADGLAGRLFICDSGVHGVRWFGQCVGEDSRLEMTVDEAKAACEAFYRALVLSHLVPEK